MTRITALSLALVAVFAIGAMASSAMAGKIETNLVNVNLKGEQPAGTNDVFTFDESGVECENATYNPVGITANNAKSITVHPEYAECFAFGFAVHVDTANCNYTGSANTTNGTYNVEKMLWNAANIVINCNVNPITFNVGKGICVVTLGSQTIGGTNLTIENTTNNPMDFHFKATNVALEVNKSVDTIFCPLKGTGAGNGNYNGRATVRAFDPTNAAQVGITIVQ